MLTDQDIRTLVEFESHDAPVLSVYLNLDPRRRAGDAGKLTLRNLLAKAEGAGAEDLQRVQNYVELGYNRQGRGLAMFSCAPHNFWWARSFAVPVEDAAFVTFRPNVRPLANLTDTYERYGVIQVDSEGARLFLFNMGVLEAADGYLGEEVKMHKAGGWSSARYQRHEQGQAHSNLQEAAEMAEEFYRAVGARHLILAGTDKNVKKFQELLSHRLRSIVVGNITVKGNATADDVREKALELAQASAETEDRRVADDVISRAGRNGNAVLGLRETLTAVQNMRAEHVVVLGSYAQPAYRFLDSGDIVLTISEDGQLGSGRIQELPDAVESVLRRALLQGIAVTILDDHAALGKAGKIGALTRW
ncbi:MAG: Vms1/Ankzf1 family peptidyl-tRNA hydrolase [Caldilineaceae bacterium]